MAIMERLSLSAARHDDGAVGAPLLEVLPGDETVSGEGIDRLKKGLEDIFNLM